MKGRIQKTIGRRSYVSQYGDFSPFLFRTLVSDEDAPHLLLTNNQWLQPPAHGAAAAVTPPPPLPLGLVIGALNIQDGQGFGLVQAIWAVERGKFDVVVLTKTKISMTAYCRNRLGYEVTCSTA